MLFSHEQLVLSHPYSYPCVLARCFVPVTLHSDSEHVVHVSQLFQRQSRGSFPVHDVVDVVDPAHGIPPQPTGMLEDNHSRKNRQNYAIIISSHILVKPLV